MIYTDVREQLKREIAEKCEISAESIDENTPLPDLGLDSLQALQLVVLLERTYHISIGDDDLQHFQTISKIAEFVTMKVGEATATAG